MIEVTDAMANAAYDAVTKHIIAMESGWITTGAMRVAIEAALAAHKPADQSDLARELREAADILIAKGMEATAGLAMDAADALDACAERDATYYFGPGR